MAQATDLIGFGEHPLKAEILTYPPVFATATGTSIGTAKQIGPRQYFTVCLAGTSGFVMPQVGGQDASHGALLGDEYVVANLSTAALDIYIANNAAGSAVTMYGGAVSTAGTTGVSVAIGYMAILRPFTVSSWIIGVASV